MMSFIAVYVVLHTKKEDIAYSVNTRFVPLSFLDSQLMYKEI